MRFSYRCLGLLVRSLAVLSLAVPLACIDSQGEMVAPVPGVSGQDATIVFDHQGTLKLLPGQTAQVTARGEPADHYEVAFFLVGEALDASLDRNVVVADANGMAVATLRAPNGPTTFAVRATIKDGPSADLPVAVSEQGFGTLSISPEYGGDRPTHTWVANVVAGTDCETLSASLPEDPDGALPAEAADGTPLIIPDAPVGPNLAVAVRAGHYMWGCADEPNLVAGQTTAVSVHIVNKPIDGSEVQLNIQMSVVPNAAQWSKLAAGSIAQMLEVFFDHWSTDNEALLEAICGQATQPTECQAARSAGDWDELVASYLLTHGISLSASLQDWIEHGLTSEPLTITALVDSQRTTVEGYGILTVQQLGGVTPTQAAVPSEYLVPFAVDLDDTVRLGGTLFWMPSQYFGAAAAQGAFDQFPQQSTVGEALVELIDCDQLGQLLGGYGDCDADCMQQLCTEALESSWQAALAVSSNSGLVGELTLEASGQASFDDVAVLTGFDGTWLGKVSNGLLQSDVQGVISAETADNTASSKVPARQLTAP